MIANPPWHHQLIGRGGGRGGTIDNYPDTARSDGSVPWFLRGFETICEQDDVGCRSSIGAGIESIEPRSRHSTSGISYGASTSIGFQMTGSIYIDLVSDARNGTRALVHFFEILLHMLDFYL
jgi:hypothetical protein